MSRQGGTPIGCDDFRQSLALNRRGFLKAGVLGSAGLTLSDLLRRDRERLFNALLRCAELDAHLEQGHLSHCIDRSYCAQRGNRGVANLHGAREDHINAVFFTDFGKLEAQRIAWVVRKPTT